MLSSEEKNKKNQFVTAMFYGLQSKGVLQSLYSINMTLLISIRLA